MMTPLEARLTEENAALRAENKAQQIEIKLLREKASRSMTASSCCCCKVGMMVQKRPGLLGKSRRLGG